MYLIPIQAQTYKTIIKRGSLFNLHVRKFQNYCRCNLYHLSLSGSPSFVSPITSVFSLPSDTIPVSSSTDWQAAFGFGSSSKQQDDDLGFDPFDVTRKALADLIEKELSVQDQSPSSPGPLTQGSNHGPSLPPSNPNPSASHHFPSGLPRVPQHHRTIYSSFSFPSTHNSQASQQQPAARHPWLGVPTRNNLTHLNHSASAASHSNFLDLNLPPQHSTGLGGIPISGTRPVGHFGTFLCHISVVHVKTESTSYLISQHMCAAAWHYDTCFD